MILTGDFFSTSPAQSFDHTLMRFFGVLPFGKMFAAERRVSGAVLNLKDLNLQMADFSFHILISRGGLNLPYPVDKS
jgi:hypothetical protein